MNDPLISIIIPTYNRAQFIAETLTSVKNQTYQNWECIVVDDGSTDNTIEIIQQFTASDNRFNLYLRPTNRPKGANACRNYGFEVSSGLYINWFDSDDIMAPTFIDEKHKAISQNRTLDGIISKRAFFKNTPDEVYAYERRTEITPDVINDFLQLKVSWYLQDVMWTRQFLEGKLLFDEVLLAGQDREFFVRMLMFDPNLKVIDVYLTMYRFHDQNITSQFNSIKHRSLKISHLYSTRRLIKMLLERKRLNSQTRMHLFKSLMRYYPYVRAKNEDFQTLKSALKLLGGNSPSYVILWAKLYISILSFKIFGKGETFLR
ncbi:MAG: glycosyltransferase family 2 protein [Flavobacterium sp.]|nr:glycosyltransferase family 2 protein [Flavobacterium sp.]